MDVKLFIICQPYVIVCTVWWKMICIYNYSCLLFLKNRKNSVFINAVLVFLLLPFALCWTHKLQKDCKIPARLYVSQNCPFPMQICSCLVGLYVASDHVKYQQLNGPTQFIFNLLTVLDWTQFWQLYNIDDWLPLATKQFQSYFAKVFFISCFSQLCK